MAKEICILIGGDLCPINRCAPLFKDGNASDIFNDYLHEMESADLTVVNLECPLVDSVNPIPKIGPALHADTDCIRGIGKSGIDMVNLANNHILDQGWEGLRSTLDVCEKNSIGTFGAGINLDEARQIKICEIKGKRIGFLGIAEHEFSIATEINGGANPLDMIDFVRNVNSHNNEYDYLIVLYHGGNELYPYPSPRLMNECRFLIEQGAALVVCQHSHVPGCYEKYQNGYIVYGQGNLIFDYSGHNNPDWNKGFLVKLVINQDGTIEVSYHLYIQCDMQAGLRKMNAEQEAQFQVELERRSEAIRQTGFVQEEWLKYCASLKYSALGRLFWGGRRIFNKLNKNGILTKAFSKGNHLLIMLNLIRCEAHREVLIGAIESVIFDRNRSNKTSNKIEKVQSQ
jgi:poly-gamma-glutamate capsule biosynthesis protein CapA/YwtB (metallophosphatase superfamily)